MSDTLELGETVTTDAVEEARQLAAGSELVVVKAGTNSLTDETSNLDSRKVEKLVEDVIELHRQGKDVLLVSSGAVGAGKGLIDLSNETVEESQAPSSDTVEKSQVPSSDTVEKSQALSTVGQSQLMRQYTESFERFDQTVAQILLTENDLEAPDRFTNFTNTVETLLEWGIVPIINENDAVATEELRIGDNDMLSSSVAIGVDADLLVTLTDVGGVYTGNPKNDSSAERIEAVGSNYGAVQEMVEDSSTGGFGGIQTKVAGARSVSEHGIPAIIAKSSEDDVFERIDAAKPVGTIFIPTNEVDDD